MARSGIGKILVASDGTKTANKSLKMAVSLASQFGASLTCVCVTATPAGSEFAGRGSVSKRAEEAARKVIERAEALAAQNGVACKGRIARGDAGYNIIKMANNKKAGFDILVLGSRGRGTLTKMFLGSVSNYVVQSSKIPVLLVK